MNDQKATGHKATQSATAAKLAATALIVLAPVVMFASYAATSNHLPARIYDPYAWSQSVGTPDRPAAVLFGAAAVALTSAVVAVGLILLRGPSPRRRGIVLTLAFLSWLASATAVKAFLISFGRSSAADVHPSVWELLAASLVGGLVVGRIAELLPFDGSESHVVPDGGLSLHSRERVVWFGRSRSTFKFVGGLIASLAGAALSYWSAPWGVSLLCLGLLTAEASMASVRIDATAVSVQLGILGLRRRRVGLVDIDRALPDRFRIGNSWKFSRASLGLAQFNVRNGPALTLERDRWPVLQVSVDNPIEAAEIVNGLLRRQRLQDRSA